MLLQLGVLVIQAASQKNWRWERYWRRFLSGSQTALQLICLVPACVKMYAKEGIKGVVLVDIQEAGLKRVEAEAKKLSSNSSFGKSSPTVEARWY